MLVNLTDVFTSENKTVTMQLPLEAETVTVNGETFPITEKSQIELTLNNVGTGKALVRARMKLAVKIPCDRCLREVKCPLELDVEEEVFSPERQESTQEDALSFMEGYQLDVDNLLNNEILLNWPMKVLCKEDCKGICKVCGKDLNEGPCGCDTFVPDPRMAAIKDIFDANKEV